MLSWHGLVACVAASVCAVIAPACGGDDVVSRCVDRFNSPANEMREFVANTGREAMSGGRADAGFRAPAWVGESKVRPEKCVAVVGLGDQGAFVVLRENFNPGAEPGTWNGLPGTSEGTPEELGSRIREPVAVVNPDGTIEAK